MSNLEFSNIQGTVTRIWPVKVCKNGSYMFSCQLKPEQQDELSVVFFDEDPNRLPSVIHGKQYAVVGQVTTYNGRQRILMKSPLAIIDSSVVEVPVSQQSNDEAVFGGCMAVEKIRATPKTGKEKALDAGITETDYNLICRAKDSLKNNTSKNSTEENIWDAITEIALKIEDSNSKVNPIFLCALISAIENHWSIQ